MKVRESSKPNKDRLVDIYEINNYLEESIFKPENLIDAAIKQKSMHRKKVPSVCILDPDGDIVRYLVKHGNVKKSETWPCYHTDMYIFQKDGADFGIIGCAVGAPYAVLLAEELFALGCQLVVSITSAGLIDNSIKTPCFMLIENTIRDEGTSYHYIPKSSSVELDATIKTKLSRLIQDKKLIGGTAWTTDAPFRETQSKVDYMKNLGVIAVEMESSALYSFAKAKKKNVVCFAHITNQMGIRDNDFDKGNENGSEEALKIISATAKLVQ